MADFCHHCSIEMFGQDYGDLANLTTEKDTEEGRFLKTLCEGCGLVLVNHRGVVVQKLDPPEGPKTDSSFLPNIL